MFQNLCKSPIKGKSRYFLRLFTALTCGVFIFVFYFVNGVQQHVKMEVAQRLQSQVVDYRQRCVLPIYWAGQSSRYTVLYNFIPADTLFEYNESITYTTHGTAKYLSHVENIAKRWNGPISLAVYAPSTDFEDTLSVIQYLRQCASPLVRQLTTFHLFFDSIYKPSAIPCSMDDYITTIDCDTYVYPNISFQTENNLSYPVNVARNIARISAQTQYVLPSDIELYPSINLIPMFLDMIDRINQQDKNNFSTNTTNSTTETTLSSFGNISTGAPPVGPNTNGTTKSTNDNHNSESDPAPPANSASKKSDSAVPAPGSLQYPSTRTVYVLPIFEVDKSLPAPDNKSDLVDLLKKEKVVPFHKFVCPECHRVPKQDSWLNYVPDNETMSVFYSTKRHKPYNNWEPIYIGTNEEPLYDERLNWEGMSDKMTQAYEMCLLDYNFSILDNAFLVHAPGIKHYSKSSSEWRKDYVKQNSKLRKQIKKELSSKYAVNTKCTL